LIQIMSIYSHSSEHSSAQDTGLFGANQVYLQTDDLNFQLDQP